MLLHCTLFFWLHLASSGAHKWIRASWQWNHSTQPWGIPSGRHELSIPPRLNVRLHWKLTPCLRTNFCLLLQMLMRRSCQNTRFFASGFQDWRNCSIGLTSLTLSLSRVRGFVLPPSGCSINAAWVWWLHLSHSNPSSSSNYPCLVILFMFACPVKG